MIEGQVEGGVVQGRRRAPLVGAAPVIANAIADAADIRLRALPMTPERVLDALIAEEG